MASIVSHPAVLLGLAPAFGSIGRSGRVLLAGALCTLVPDVDAIGFWMGVPYGSPFGHRGLTHSIAFAAVLAAAGTALLLRQHGREGSPWPPAAFLFLCATTHGLLDAMTDGGLGVAFFAPFDSRRFFLPWQPIAVSPIGTHGFFGPRGAAILASEAAWIWFPSLALGAVVLCVRRAHRWRRSRPERRRS